jgi:hypothetical protein
MYTTIRHELRQAKKAWPGTLADPPLLSGWDLADWQTHRRFPSARV